MGVALELYILQLLSARSLVVYIGIKSIEISMENYYDALWFIVNNHLLFTINHNYKYLIKNWQLPAYFC
jgi:hypothetical protein